MRKFTWNKKYFYLCISWILFIAVWEITAFVIGNEIYIPKLENVCKEFINIIKDKNFIKYISYSFGRSILSYTAALLAAGILGILSSLYPLFRYFLTPVNSFVKTIPTMVLVVLALIWFNKDSAPFVVGAAIVFPILYEGFQSTINNADKKLLEMCDIYEVSHKDKILKIYFPLIKAYIINIFVSSLSLTFKVVIAGEVHGQPKYGIGGQIQLEKVNFNTAGIFAWIVIIVIISLIFEIINKIMHKNLKEKGMADGN